MKEIDYILKNFNPKSFLLEVSKKKDPMGWCSDEILNNTKDFKIDKYDDYEEDLFNLTEVLDNYMFYGIFFQKIKEFKLIYDGTISFVDMDTYLYSIMCFYSNTDKKYHLFTFFLEADGNDSYDYIRKFKSKPTIRDLEKIFEVNKEKLQFLSYWKKKSVINIRKSKNNIKLNKYWNKELKSGLNLEHRD